MYPFTMANEHHLLESDLSRSIISAFYAVYTYFGYGLAESVYSGALVYELRRRGHTVVRELLVQVRYHDRVVAWQRLDMVVDGKVIVEIKATEKLPPYAARQVFNYLRATRYEIGLLLHFGPEPKVHRFVDFPKRGAPGTVGTDLNRMRQDETG
jgi:GxxExxY protein